MKNQGEKQKQKQKKTKTKTKKIHRQNKKQKTESKEAINYLSFFIIFILCHSCDKKIGIVFTFNFIY